MTTQGPGCGLGRAPADCLMNCLTMAAPGDCTKPDVHALRLRVNHGQGGLGRVRDEEVAAPLLMLAQSIAAVYEPAHWQMAAWASTLA